MDTSQTSNVIAGPWQIKNTVLEEKPVNVSKPKKDDGLSFMIIIEIWIAMILFWHPFMHKTWFTLQDIKITPFILLIALCAVTQIIYIVSTELINRDKT